METPPPFATDTTATGCHGYNNHLLLLTYKTLVIMDTTNTRCHGYNHLLSWIHQSPVVVDTTTSHHGYNNHLSSRIQ